MAMLASVVTVAALAGCGGSGDDETVSLTKKQFVAQANAICRKQNEDIGAKYDAFLKEHEKQPATAAETAEFANQVYFANLQLRLEALKELPPPAADEAQITALLDALEADLAKAEAKEAVPYEETEAIFAQTNKLAENYELIYCLVA
jgi:hypothetical protein